MDSGQFVPITDVILQTLLAVLPDTRIHLYSFRGEGRETVRLTENLIISLIKLGIKSEQCH